MTYNIYHVNAFTNELFTGNPAAIYLLEKNLSDHERQQIAMMNQLPVTAFVREHDDGFDIRWVTPEEELPLCGHGTLAAAWVLFEELGIKKDLIHFHSPHAGLVSVRHIKNTVELNFPAKTCQPITGISDILEEGLGAASAEIYVSGDRLLIIFDNEILVKTLVPKFEILKKFTYRGIIVSSPGNDVDFVSRTFYPNKPIPEDAVTGASHCVLVPYWSKYFNKTGLHAHQISPRGGELFCELSNDRVLLRGRAIVYSKEYRSI